MATAVDLAAELLGTRCGLAFDSASQRRLERGVKEAAAAAGLDPLAYVVGLRADPLALRDLLERATLQETGFFRDEDIWPPLAGLLRAAAERGPVRVWSAGCAYGQEAWSLAMLCEELRLPDWRVLATDVSGAALGGAAAGEYDARELRGLSAARRRRFGRPLANGGWAVGDGLRGHVTFARHNLAVDPPPAVVEACSLVTCRYVLIYLRQDAILRFVRALDERLPAHGHLVVGASESLWHATATLQLVPLGGHFAYAPRRRRPPFAARRRVAPRAWGAGAAPPSPPAGHVGLQADPPPLPEPGALLSEGEEAVADGRLGDAVTAFRRAAYLDPGDPLAHLRLGLVLEELADEGATRAFRAAWAALGRSERSHVADALGGYRPEELVTLLASKLEGDA